MHAETYTWPQSHMVHAAMMAVRGIPLPLHEGCAGHPHASRIRGRSLFANRAAGFALSELPFPFFSTVDYSKE